MERKSRFGGKMVIKEAALTEELLGQLICLSEAWEKEGCCHGYIKNTPGDIKGNRVFAAFEDSAVIGYLFGHEEVTERTTSIYSSDPISNIFPAACTSEKSPFVAQVCRLRRRAQCDGRKTLGKGPQTFPEGFPHVPLVGKGRRPLPTD